MPNAMRRRLTGPVTPAIVLVGVAALMLVGQISGIAFPLVAWVVFAISAGYAISGSV